MAGGRRRLRLHDQGFGHQPAAAGPRAGETLTGTARSRVGAGAHPQAPCASISGLRTVSRRRDGGGAATANGVAAYGDSGRGERAAPGGADKRGRARRRKQGDGAAPAALYSGPTALESGGRARFRGPCGCRAYRADRLRRRLSQPRGVRPATMASASGSAKLFSPATRRSSPVDDDCVAATKVAMILGELANVTRQRQPPAESQAIIEEMAGVVTRRSVYCSRRRRTRSWRRTPYSPSCGNTRRGRSR